MTPDRYALLEEIGSGGMGVVWAAYDRHLDRKVALKLLQDQFLGAADQERLASEARTMAKLAHPNVVSVFDVGTREGRTFLAMEFVQGRSLAEWLRARPGWSDVVTVFRDIARGLAAAHAAGIVHRDVKPGNILVGDDGRARIADFGVSRADDGAGTPPGHSPRSTEATGVVGTPAYMAPEQLRAEHVDARADQFGLCVALHEALTGERPFEGETVDELLAAIERGAPPVPGVPDWLAAIVRRGLAARAHDRFPTTDALAAALEGPAPSKLKRAGWIAAASVAIAVPAVVLGLGRASSEEPPIACDVEARAAFRDTWTPARRAALVDAFAKTGLPGAAETGTAIADAADRLADAWVARWETSCRASRIEHTWPAELGVQSTMCLDENRIKLSALLDALGRPDEVAIATGADMLRRSDPVTPCGDPDYLRGRVIPPREPAHAAEIAALEPRVAALNIAFGLRRLDEAARDFPALMADVERVRDPRLMTQMLAFESILARNRGDLPAAIAASKRAYLLARRHRDIEAAARAAADLIWLYGFEKGDAAAGDDWAELALVEIESIPHAPIASRVYSAIGWMAEHHGQLARAVEAQRKATAQVEHYYGTDHYSTALQRQYLASALSAAGQVDEAIPLFREALAVLERDLGPTSLAYAHALGYFASMVGHAGELAEARTAAIRAVEIGRAAGAQGDDLAALLVYQGLVLQLAGELEPAITALADAHASYVATGNRGLAASSLGFLGGARAELAVQRADRSLEQLALGDLERAVREIEEAWAADHPDRAEALYSLALLHAARGRCNQAIPVAERSVAIFDKEPGNPRSADPLLVLGRCLIEKSAYAEAVAQLERAVAVRGTERGPIRRATAEAWLGLALLGTQQGTRARELLSRARTTLASKPEVDQELIDRIDRALAE